MVNMQAEHQLSQENQQLTTANFELNDGHNNVDPYKFPNQAQ